MSRRVPSTALLVVIVVTGILFVLTKWLDEPEQSGASLEELPAVSSKTIANIEAETKKGPEISTDADDTKAIVISEQEDTSVPTKTIATQNPYAVPRNEIEVQLKQNHKSIFSVQKEIHAFLQQIAEKQVDESINIPDFQKWAEALYKDAILARLLKENLSDSDRYVLNQELSKTIRQPNMDLIKGQILTTNEYYGKSLRNLLVSVYENNLEELTPSQSISLTNRFKDLANKRKRYSNNYYKTEMRAYLLDEANSFDEKLVYMEPFIEAEDWSLVKYGSNYFYELHEHRELTAEEKAKITAVQNKIKGSMGQ